jgi:putative transposase
MGNKTAPFAWKNRRWSMNCMQDRTMNGQKIRILTVVDEVSHECPVIAVDTSMTGRKVAAVLNQVNWFHPLPKEIKTDNGPEFTGCFIHQWCEEHKVDHVFTEPGNPTQNGHIESFNGRLRDECLNLHWFKTLQKLGISFSSVMQHSMSLIASQGQAAASGGGCVLPPKPPI